MAAQPGQAASAPVRSAGHRSASRLPAHDRAAQPVRIALSQQMKIGQEVHGNITTQRKISMAADSRELDHALVNEHVVDLIRIGRRMGASDRNIDRRINRDADINHVTREMAAASIAGTVGPRCDRVGATSQDGEYVSARCGVAVTAVSPDAGHLKGRLIQMHVVCLVGMSAGTISRHRDVDWAIHRERCVDEASIRVTVSAIAGLAAAAVYQRRLYPAVGGSGSRPERGHVAAACRIAVSAIAADTGNLDGRLIDLNRIGLSSLGRATRACDGNIYRMVDYNRSVHQAPEEVSAATIAGAFAAGRYHVGAGGRTADVSPRCGVAIAAVSSNAGDLNG